MTGSNKESDDSTDEIKGEIKTVADPDQDESVKANQDSVSESDELLPLESEQKEDAESDGINQDQESTQNTLETQTSNAAKGATPKARSSMLRFLSVQNIVLVITALLLVGVLAALAYGAILAKGAQADLQAQIAELKKSNNQNTSFIEQVKSEVENHKQALSADVSKQVKKLEGEFNKLNSSAQASLKEQQAAVQNQNSKLQQMGQRLDGQQKRLLTLSTTNKEDWLLAEAEYLMRLASQRVLIERAPHNAIALLEAADKIILQVSNGLGDPELFGIRDAIAREVMALKLVAGLDREGLYLKIQALVDQIDALPTLPKSSLVNSRLRENQEAPNLEVKTEKDEPWQKRVWTEIKATFGALDNYIRLEDRDKPIKPLADQYAAQMSSLNVRLLLQQAQIALLKEKPVLFSKSLNEAAELVEKYYVETAESKEFQLRLIDLSSIDVAPALPDISQSLKLLNGYIREIHLINDSSEKAQ